MNDVDDGRQAPAIDSDSNVSSDSSLAVAEHYDRYAQMEWERLERHRTELAVTQLAIDEHLPPSADKIIDIGSGPGRYAIELANRGYRVDLVDISSVCLRLAEDMAAAKGVELGRRLTRNALDLPREFTGTYDAALLMGPLYHLLEHPHRLAAIHEAHRVLKDGGILFASFITRYAPIRDLAIHSPEWIVTNPQRFRSLLRAGENPAHQKSAFPDSYFARPEEISPLMTEGGFRQVALVGCEGIVAGHEGAVNELEGTLWDEWVRLNYELGQEPSLYGAADHLLYVGVRG